MTARHSSGVVPLDAAASAALLARTLEAARAPDAVVVFDLDSTLLDNRPRQARIMREYGEQHGVAALAAGRPEHWQGWDFRVAMRNAGLDAAAIERHHAAFRAYWTEHFFTSAYCVDDDPIAGAIGFLAAVAEAGALIAYVTGRHEPMREGTVACLVRHGMPRPDAASKLPAGHGGRVRLLMKPTLEEHDDAYKARTYRELDALGRVVAAFDNEPTHINGYRTSFPDAVVVHLATDHSLRGVAVIADIPSVVDFAAFRAEPARPERDDVNGGRILVVDDDALLRMSVADVLEDEGYVVDHAVDGVDALAKIAAQRPDVILLDILMPRMNGKQLLEMLRDDPATAEIPVLMMTAIQGFDAHRTTALGAGEVVEKPFDFDELLNKIALAVFRAGA